MIYGIGEEVHLAVEFDGSAGALVLQNEMLGMAEDFEDIRKATRGVTEEQFRKAVKFCWLLSEGKSKVESYVEAYGGNKADKITQQSARSLAGRKYVRDILNRMVSGNHLLFADKHVVALNEMFDIGMDRAEKTRDRLDALKAFAELTKKPEAIKMDVDITHHIGQEMVEKVDKLTQTLAAKGSMIGPDGEIVDTVVLD
jgi:hypothetical protein